MSDASRILEVVLWSNGMLMVFDEKDQHIPELEGAFTQTLQQEVLARTDQWTVFAIGSYGVGTVPMKREQFSSWFGGVSCYTTGSDSPDT